MSKTVFNVQLLHKVVERDGCVVDLELYETVNRDVRIDFICCCGSDGNKTLRNMYERGAFCKNCTLQKRFERTEATCLARYGVKYSSQAPEIKEKERQTNLERYGVANVFQAQEVKDKTKQTCMDKYGVEYAAQIKEIQEKKVKTNLQRYGVVNPAQSNDIQEKMKTTNMQRYGVPNATQSKEVQDKMKQTCVERFGVENAFQSDEIKQKIKETWTFNYNCDNPSKSDKVKETMKQTFQHNLGVDNPMQSADVKEAFKNTCLLRYGVEHPAHVPEFEEKKMITSFSKKTFVFPCGQERHVQGYEPLALQLLVDQNYTSDQIQTDKDKVPEIWYEFTERRRRYYPDIYIPSENKIIEVKSTWTYKKDEEKNLLKEQACKDAGYVFEFWVFDGKGNKIDMNLCQELD